MKLKGLSILLMALFLLTACEPSQKSHDFRGADWGDSKSAVVNSESSEYVFGTDDLLVFDTTIDDFNAEVYYDFADDQLVIAQLKLLADGKRTIAEMLTAYENYAAALTELYGPPLNADPAVWLDSDPAYQGDAHAVSIYNQRLEYLLEWHTETTRTTLLLNYRDAQINFIHFAEPIAAQP